jgi:hypothetical protein
MKKLSRALFVCFLLIACKQTPAFDPTLLEGEWRGAQWLTDGRSSGRDVESVRFEFKAGNAYVANYGEQKETGAYRMEGKKLYTTAEGQKEKVVEVRLPSNDTLQFDMNRAGQIERLVLVRLR